MIFAICALIVLLGAGLYLEELDSRQAAWWVVFAIAVLLLVRYAHWSPLVGMGILIYMDAALVLFVFKQDIIIPSGMP